MHSSLGTAIADHFYRVWAVIGPLIGVLIGSLLASRWQRQQWIRDNKKVDYRGIFDALNSFRWQVSHFYAVYDQSPGADHAAEGRKRERQEAISEALSSVIGVMGSSIFVREAILRSGIIPDFQAFYHHLLEDERPPTLEQAVHSLTQYHLRLLQTAWHDLGLSKPFPRGGATRSNRETKASDANAVAGGPSITS